MKFWFIVISLRPLLVDKRVSSVVAVVVECVLIDFVGIFFFCAAGTTDNIHLIKMDRTEA